MASRMRAAIFGWSRSPIGQPACTTRSRRTGSTPTSTRSNSRASVAACRVLQHLVEGFVTGDEQVTRALRTRTFYVVPRVNPDGAEWALADSPHYRRSSVRNWPLADGRRWPGHESEDIDGDGRILQMRIADPDGQWMPHPDDERLLVPVPLDGPGEGTHRYRLFGEGTIEDFDGFTMPKPRVPQGLDMNRNFPAGWGTTVPGSGDHPLSEPEIDAPHQGDHRSPKHLWIQRVPHVRRCAVAAVVDCCRRNAPAERRVGVEGVCQARQPN